MNEESGGSSSVVENTASSALTTDARYLYYIGPSPNPDSSALYRVKKP